MPKPSNPPVPTGTFSDLYEAMQKRRAGDQPSGSEVQTSGLPDTNTPRRPDVQTPRRQAQRPAPVPAPTAETEELALSHPAERRFTLRISEGEYEALIDLETEIRRAHDIELTKNDIIRCGIQHIIRDYRLAKKDSILLQEAKKK